MMTRTRFLQDRSCADVPISLGPGAVAGTKRELSADSLRAGMTGPIVSRADTPGMKAARGLAAITTPFLEIPGNIVETSKSEGQLAGWTTGLAKGIGMSVVRPPIGVYELLTAPIAFPANFAPIMKPEYPWSYFGSVDDREIARHPSLVSRH